MKISGIIKIVLALVVLLIVGGLVYYFMFSPSVKYGKLVGNADELFDDKHFGDAKLLYIRALKINKEEPYPNHRIIVIDSIIRQNELQAQYVEKIQKADDLFESKDYGKASQYYFEAANLMPDADYPVEQIQLCRKLTDDPSYVEPVQKSVVQPSPENKPKTLVPVKTETPKNQTVVPQNKPKTTISATATNHNQNTLADGKYYHVVVGVFSNHQNAVELNEKLIREGRDSRIIYRPGKSEVVTFGSYKDFNTASSFLKFVKNDINKNAWVLHFEK